MQIQANSEWPHLFIGQLFNFNEVTLNGDYIVEIKTPQQTIPIFPLCYKGKNVEDWLH